MNDNNAPLTAPECDLQDFPFMPLQVARLRDSDLAATEHPEACWYAVLLWAASWHQVPAASLPDDEMVLTRLCGLGRDVKTFRKHRAGALRGFVTCADGRLYHPVVAEQANAAWKEKLAYRDRKEKRQTAGAEGAKAKWDNDASDGLTRSQRLSLARTRGRHTKAEWEAMVEHCGDACVRCSAIVPLVKDHITPIYQGGSDAIDNLQPLCTPCNSSKGPEAVDHRPHGWQAAIERLSERVADINRTPAERLAKRLPKGTGTETGTIIVDDERERAIDVVDLTADLARMAGVGHLAPGRIAQNIDTVREWINHGAMPDEMRGAVQDGVSAASAAIHSLKYFSGAVRQRVAKRENGNGSTGQGSAAEQSADGILRAAAVRRAARRAEQQAERA